MQLACAAYAFDAKHARTHLEMMIVWIPECKVSNHPNLPMFILANTSMIATIISIIIIIITIIIIIIIIVIILNIIIIIIIIVLPTVFPSSVMLASSWIHVKPICAMPGRYSH